MGCCLQMLRDELPLGGPAFAAALNEVKNLAVMKADFVRLCNSVDKFREQQGVTGTLKTWADLSSSDGGKLEPHHLSHVMQQLNEQVRRMLKPNKLIGYFRAMV